jgi:RHS repeat-associated protein
MSHHKNDSILENLITAAFVVPLLLSTASANVVTTGGDQGAEGSTAFTGLSQTPEANLFTGSMTMSIPIQIPPGRPNATPELKLVYDSSSGPSPYGFGWDLSLGTIERSTRNGVPSCNVSGGPGNYDDFVLKMNGATVELVNSTPPPGSPSNVYYAKYDESYVIAEASKGTGDNNNWVVHDRRGMTFRFGQTQQGPYVPAGARASTGTDEFMDDSNGGCDFTAVWALTQIEDPNGNTIDIKYEKVSNVIYPKQIEYGANPSANLSVHPFLIVFDWDDGKQPDVASRRRGIAETLTRAITDIEVHIPSSNPDLVRQYHFDHTADTANGRLFLTTVSATGLPNETFKYASINDGSAIGLLKQQSRTGVTPQIRRVGPHEEVFQTAMDMNGDGFVDVVTTGPGDWTVYYGGAEQFSDGKTWAVHGLVSGKMRTTQDVNGFRQTTYDTQDVTGDGIPDLIDASTATWHVYKGQCSSSTSCGFSATPEPSFSSPPEQYLETERNSSPFHWTLKALIDINGDGFVDLVKANVSGINPNQNPLTYDNAVNSNANWIIYLGSATGFASTPWAGFTGVGPIRTQYDANTLVWTVDFNGDGLPDHLKALNDSPGLAAIIDGNGEFKRLGIYCSSSSEPVASGNVLETRLNSGRGFEPGIYSAIPNYLTLYAQGLQQSESCINDLCRAADTLDVNGDGLPDWVFAETGGPVDDQGWKVLLNRGDGRLEPVVPPSVLSCTGNNGSGNPLPTASVNQLDQRHWPLLAPMKIRRLKIQHGNDTWTERDVMDLNGDGLLDNVFSTNNNNNLWDVALSSRSAAVDAIRPGLLVEVNNGFRGKTEIRYKPSTAFPNNGPADQPEDKNGPDLPFVTWVVTGIRQTDGLCEPLDGSDHFDRVGNRCIKGNGTQTGGHEILKTFRYANGLFDAPSREFRGFGTVIVADAEGNETLYEFSQENAIRGKMTREEVLAGTFDPTDPNGTVVETGEPVRETTYKWLTESSLGRTQVYLGEQRTEDFPAFAQAAGATSQCLITRNEAPDDYGRVGLTCSLACDVAPAQLPDAASCSPKKPGQVETQTVWATPLPTLSGTLVYERPTTVETRYYPTGVTAQRLVYKMFEYDATGVVSKGNVRHVRTDIGDIDFVLGAGASADVFTEHGDGFGNITAMTDPNGHTTTYDYTSAPFSLYAATEKISGTPYEISRVNDLRFGKPEVVTDVQNGVSTVRKYDSLGRVECEAGPGDNCDSDPTVTYAYHFADPAAVTPFEAKLSWVETRRTDPNATNSGGVLTSRVYFDALGRTRFSTVQRVIGDSAAAPRFVVEGQTQYDSVGRIAATFAPYKVDGNGTTQDLLTVPETPTTAVTTFDYVLNGNPATIRDPLGRPYEVFTPDIGVGEHPALSYFEGSRTRTVNPRDDETWSMRDAFGREVRREEHPQDACDGPPDGDCTVPISFSYSYDGLGRLLSTTTSDNPNNRMTTVTQWRDGLGRVYHRVDPDSGLWRYGYDAKGNVLFEDDPKPNQHVQMCYDTLDRLKRRCTFNNDDYVPNACNTACASGVVESVYSYDEPSHGFSKGRLTTVVDQSGLESFVYDERGRVTGTTKQIKKTPTSTISASTGFAYDEGDHLVRIRYPDGELVWNFYGAAGQLVSVQQDSLVVGPYVSSIEYDIFGRMTKLVHGNGVIDTESYYGGSENFRLQGIRVDGPDSANHLNLQYSYNELAKIKQITDSRDTSAPLSNTATFGYDGLGRLEDATGPAYALGFTYDAVGNITLAEGGPLAYDNPAKPHQATARGLSLVIQHDANGNLTFKQTQTDSITNTYDPLNRLLSSTYTNSGNQQTQKYDYTGRRVFRKENAGAPDLFFSKLMEFDDSAIVNQYYYAGDRLVAARWNYNPAFGTGVAPAVPLRIPPELPLAVGSVAILLLLGFGRRKQRILITIGPSRALGASLLLLAATPPIGLFTPTVAQADCEPNISTVHYHLDHLGSTQVITNSLGQIQQQIRYTAFGKTRGRWDASGTPVGPDPTGLTREYTGYESDNLTGFEYAGARFYDPELGQFLSHDPEDQFASPYSYCGGDPLNSTDPNGEFGFDFATFLAAALILGSIAHSAYQAQKAGASIGQTVAVATSEVGSSLVSAGVLGPVSNPSEKADPAMRFGVLIASVGFSTYASIQSARNGDAFGAAIAGLNSAIAAFGIADGVVTSGQSKRSSQGDAAHEAYLNAIGEIEKSIAKHPGEAVPLSAENLYAIMDWEALEVGDLSSLSDSEYREELYHADGQFLTQWAHVNFTVSEPSSLAGTYSGSTINYYLQGFKTASAGRSVVGMYWNIFRWNAGQAIGPGTGTFRHDIPQIFSGSAWARYGYDYYMKNIKTP